ncbi:hypothetical protein MAR_003115, partial [Mya arenaria]
MEKAKSIFECPDIEEIWREQIVFNETIDSDYEFMLSRSENGPYLHVMCPKGSHVIGPSVITCLNGGIWSEITKPTCSYSSLIGIPDSDLLLIGVFASCSLILVLGLAAIVAHIVCVKCRPE